MDIDFVNYKFENGFVGVVTRTKFRLGIRHVQLVYMCLCAVVFGVLRGAAPVAVLALADRSRLNDTYIQVYNYNKSVQGTVMSSFLWGHALLLVPAQLARGALGGKLMISAALLVNGAIYVALPTIVNQGGWIALCNAQFVLGMTQAAAAPALRALLLAWLPPHERETFSPIVYAGIQLGTIVAFPVAGAISASALGWELVFYSLAMMTLSAAAVWALLTAGRPADHPAVGDKEKEFIDEALKCYKQKQLKTPWGQMLRSGATWGLAAAQVGCSVVVTFFLTEVPAYLVLAHGFTVKQGATLSMLPFIAMWLTFLAVNPTVESIYKIGFVNYLVSNTRYRKIISTLGACGTVLGLWLVPLLGSQSSYLAVVLLCGTMASVAVQYVGFLSIYSDMSENYCGSLALVTRAPAAAAAAAVPLVSGFVLRADQCDPLRWRVVFLTVAAAALAGQQLLLALARAQRQYWDNQDHRMKFTYYNDVNQMELDDLKVKIIPKKTEEKNEDDLLFI